jgi:hypothetical protein
MRSGHIGSYCREISWNLENKILKIKRKRINIQEILGR